MSLQLTPVQVSTLLELGGDEQLTVEELGAPMRESSLTLAVLPNEGSGSPIGPWEGLCRVTAPTWELLPWCRVPGGPRSTPVTLALLPI